jgi:peptidyl-Lys metalloendopeptidase
MWKARYVKFLILFILLFSLLAGTIGTGAAPKSALSVTIAAEKSGFSAAEAVLVQVTITNVGQKPVKVLKWYTPVEDVEEPLFKVTRAGVTVEYVGAHFKRLAPTGNDYLNLKPGESFSRTIDLGQYYDLSASGLYGLEYNYEATALASNKIQLAVEGRSVPTLTVVPEAVTGSTSFTKCTATQQTNLVDARSNASTYAANAWSYLNAGTQGPRYVTWFGAYESSRYNTVKSHFVAISDAMDTKPVTFNCGCKKKNVYAYVYSNQPYTIYLCGVFWSAPMTGTDSKAGTLIHEMSHFTVVASTDDWAYGQTNAKSLALSDPSKAIDNADSHEYFAENTPFQQ